MANVEEGKLKRAEKKQVSLSLTGGPLVMVHRNILKE